MEYISIRQAAERLGLSERRTREICAAEKIGESIPGVRGTLLTESDLERIEEARGKRGNPSFGPGFGTGQKRPRAKKTRKTRKK